MPEFDDTTAPADVPPVEPNPAPAPAETARSERDRLLEAIRSGYGNPSIADRLHQLSLQLQANPSGN